MLPISYINDGFKTCDDWTSAIPSCSDYARYTDNEPHASRSPCPHRLTFFKRACIFGFCMVRINSGLDTKPFSCSGVSPCIAMAIRQSS